MTDQPAFEANNAALALLSDMAKEMRAAREEVSKVREDVAELKGQRLATRMDGHSLDIRTLRADLDALKSSHASELAQRKPWVFLAGEIAKLFLAAVAGAFALANMPHNP